MADDIAGLRLSDELPWAVQLTHAAGLSPMAAQPLLAALAGDHCVQLAGLAVAALGAPPPAEQVERWLSSLESASSIICAAAINGQACVFPSAADRRGSLHDTETERAFLALVELARHGQLGAEGFDRVLRVPSVEMGWVWRTSGQVPEASKLVDQVIATQSLQRDLPKLRSVLLSAKRYTAERRGALAAAVPSWEALAALPTIFIRDLLPELDRAGLGASSGYQLAQWWPSADSDIEFPFARDQQVNVIRLEAGTIRWEDVDRLLHAYADKALPTEREAQVITWGQSFLEAGWGVPESICASLARYWYPSPPDGTNVIARLESARTAVLLKLEVQVAATALARQPQSAEGHDAILAALLHLRDPILRHALASIVVQEIALRVGDSRVF